MSDGLHVFVCAVSLLFIGVIAGAALATRYEQQQAIDNGAAEWRIDAETGEREFVWVGGDR